MLLSRSSPPVRKSRSPSRHSSSWPPRAFPARVVSVPCFELFFEQTQDYQDAIIGNAPVKIAVEAGIRMGWDAIIGSTGTFIGMKSFGASGPAKELYKHFGITSDAVVAAAEAKLA